MVEWWLGGGVDFAPNTKAAEITARMRKFLDERVLPAEPVYDAWRAERRGTPAEHERPPVVEELKVEARRRGLWNLFLPAVSGLSNLDYAPVAEVSGWSPVIAPEAINCQAPDSGNMETLHRFGTPEQRRRWPKRWRINALMIDWSRSISASDSPLAVVSSATWTFAAARSSAGMPACSRTIARSASTASGRSASISMNARTQQGNAASTGNLRRLRLTSAMHAPPVQTF